MMEILKRDEAIPVDYPPTPDQLSPEAVWVDSDAVWQRIEGYVAHRWTLREVVWTVAGWGSFEPDLTPAVITSVEIWTGSAWAATTLMPTPLGGFLMNGNGPYRFTAGVGGGTVPAAVNEAFRRLSEYLADPSDRAGVSSYSVGLSGAVQESYRRSPAWVAQAMQLSGAGDLLRPFRKV